MSVYQCECECRVLVRRALFCAGCCRAVGVIDGRIPSEARWFRPSGLLLILQFLCLSRDEGP